MHTWVHSSMISAAYSAYSSQQYLIAFQKAWRKYIHTYNAWWHPRPLCVIQCLVLRSSVINRLSVIIVQSCYTCYMKNGNETATKIGIGVCRRYKIVIQKSKHLMHKNSDSMSRWIISHSVPWSMWWSEDSFQLLCCLWSSNTFTLSCFCRFKGGCWRSCGAVGWGFFSVPLLPTLILCCVSKSFFWICIFEGRGRRSHEASDSASHPLPIAR